jgi:hypothetical protein
LLASSSSKVSVVAGLAGVTDIIATGWIVTVCPADISFCIAIAVCIIAILQTILLNSIAAFSTGGGDALATGGIEKFACFIVRSDVVQNPVATSWLFACHGSAMAGCFGIIYSFVALLRSTDIVLGNSITAVCAIVTTRIRVELVAIIAGFRIIPRTIAAIKGHASVAGTVGILKKLREIRVAITLLIICSNCDSITTKIAKPAGRASSALG